MEGFIFSFTPICRWQWGLYDANVISACVRVAGIHPLASQLAKYPRDAIFNLYDYIHCLCYNLIKKFMPMVRVSFLCLIKNKKDLV